ncbi:MAG: hypothetical protein WDN48_00310 [Pseudolabrys sp.]
MYYLSFEKRGQESLRGLAFFFGLLFVTEVSLILVFGVDYRYVEAAYIGPSIHIGIIDMPLRMVVPCLAALALFGVIQIIVTKTFVGRAIMAVVAGSARAATDGRRPDQDQTRRLRHLDRHRGGGRRAADHHSPVEPSVGREYIGRGLCHLRARRALGSMPGTLIAAMLLGVVESLTATFYGPSWAPAVSFGFSCSRWPSGRPGYWDGDLT